MTKKPYHHGDLGETLLLAATEILRDSGVEGLSMRKLADKVGVSRTAPYHHFKDKNALLCAIAEAGFKQQWQSVEAIIHSHSEKAEQANFEKYVVTYIEFADQHPETYDLMFGRDIWKSGTPTESLLEISKASFRQWLSWVEELQSQGVLTDVSSALRVGQTTWATLHGLCRLLIDGIYINREDLDDMAKQTIKIMLNKQA